LLYTASRVVFGWRPVWRWSLAGHAIAACALAVALFTPLARGYGGVAEAWQSQRSVAEIIPFSATPLSFVNPWELSLAYGSGPLRQLAHQPIYDNEKRLFVGLAPPLLAGLTVIAFRRLSRQERARVVA